MELVAAEQNDLEAGLTCVIFSKDRALQLHALLESYLAKVQNPVPVFVIYGASDDGHARAYREVETCFSGGTVPVSFVPDGKGFRETLLSVLGGVRTRSIIFLVDDILFISAVDLTLASTIDPQVEVLSLRHSPHLRRSYTANVEQPPPAFQPSGIHPEVLRFNWFEQGNEWSDPWSVDGQVLSTAEVRVITRISQFRAPNSYEIALKTFNDMVKDRSGLCYTESKIINLPINRVQAEVANISGSISPAYLLEQWNKGLMMDTAMFEGHIPTAPHEEHTVGFRRRT